MENPQETAIFILSVVPILFLCFLINYGLSLTSRWYPPTISALLSDYIELSVSFGFLVACYTVIESYIAFEYLQDNDRVNELCDIVYKKPKDQNCSVFCLQEKPSDCEDDDDDYKKKTTKPVQWTDRFAHFCYLKYRCCCCWSRNVCYTNGICQNETFCTPKSCCNVDRKTWFWAAPKIARIFLMLKNAAFIMIPIVRVNEYPTMHYVFASLTVVFSLIMFGFYIVRRQCEATPENPRTWYIILNYFYFLLVFVLSAVFFFATMVDSNFIYKQYGSILEYAVFYLIGAMPIFWIADIRFENRTKHKYQTVVPQAQNGVNVSRHYTTYGGFIRASQAYV